MRIAYLSRFLLALSLSALASTAFGAVPQPLPTLRGIVVDPRARRYLEPLSRWTSRV